MKLYHTSTLEIRKPDLYRGRKNADFGQGFYLTPDWEFSRRWATGDAVINEYGWIRAEKAPGQDRIYTAGEKEYLVWLERKDKGVPVGEAVQKELLAVRDKYHLPYTFPFEG